MKHTIAIEFGGQSIKSAIVDLQGNLNSYYKLDLNQENPSTIDDFERDFNALIKATKGKFKPSAVGIAHPNPCDPKTLTFMLEQKPAYKYINGHPLNSLIYESTGLSEYHTIYDAGAAGLGELWQGKCDEKGRYLLLTLGTGLGAVFIEDSLIITGQQVKGIPESGELWNHQYMNTDLENVTGTTKAAVSIYISLGGTDRDVCAGNLKKLASIGRNDNDSDVAQKTFVEFGRRLGDSLAPIVLEFHPKAIILSGQIALAYDLFGPAAKQALQIGLNGLVDFTDFWQSDLIESGGLLGAAFRSFYPNRSYRLN
jgi:glucokinase